MESPAALVGEAVASFFPGVSLDVLAASVGRYQKLGCWRMDPAISREQYEVAMDVFLFSGVFKERYPYDDVVVNL
jgi:hypothetical protein